MFYLVLTIMALGSCRGDNKVNEYVYWKKTDVSAWHQFFPCRALENERNTNEMGVLAVQSISSGLRDSLTTAAAYQIQELRTAQLLMEGTSAQGCVQGIAPYMDNAISDLISDFEDDTADAVPKLLRLYTSWNKTNSNYQAEFQKAIAGIDSCAKTYRNWNSFGSLKTCVDTYTNNYLAVANKTKTDVYSSPSMRVVSDQVVMYLQKLFSDLISKAWLFLEKLVQCAKLSENIDSQMYEKQVTTNFVNYLSKNDLSYQILAAQNQINYKWQVVEDMMLSYYDLQKRALERYAIESRGQGYYSAQLRGYLQQYYSTVGATSVDNPGDYECATSAYAALNQLVNEGSAAALLCDQKIVNHTKFLIDEVNAYFMGINTVLPSTGNVAILSCFTEGYIFAENTVLNCFNLKISGFTVNFTKVHKYIVDDVNVLLGYEKSFYNNASLPCGDDILQKTFWGAERALYDLQRCLYIGSGTKYAVTTPISVTTNNPYTTITPPTASGLSY